MEINKLFQWKNNEFFIGQNNLLKEIETNYVV